MSDSLPDLSETFDIARESAVGQDWSKAVTFSRNAEFVLEDKSESSIIIRVLEPKKTLSTRVEIDIEACDWQTDCRCDEDPCRHVLAALIAAKNQVNFRTRDATRSAKLVYVIEIEQDLLCVHRFVEYQGARRRFKSSLREHVGGVQSGRITGASIIPSKEDFSVEQRLSKEGVALREESEELLRTLRLMKNVAFLGEAASISDCLNECELLVEDHQKGYRVRRLVRTNERRLQNGFVVSAERVISAAKEADVDSSYELNFSPDGKTYSQNQAILLSEEVLPLLARYAQITKETSFPTILNEEPYATFQVSKDGESLSVTPRILYGHPPLMEITADGPVLLEKKALVSRVVDAEKLLFRRLQTELHLQPGRTVRRSGEEAVRFSEQIREWETEGKATEEFKNEGRLIPKLFADESGLSIEFELDSLGRDGSSSNTSRTEGLGGRKSVQVSSERVLSAWENGDNLVPLQNGGWAEIPKDWFAKHGEQIKELLSLEKKGEKVVAKFQPLLLQEAESLGAEVSPGLLSLKDRLLSRLGNEERESHVPEDVTATLREYQNTGVHWLEQIRALGAGAILADDMGLGKTLQTICVLQPRSLVIAPTSVLDSWCEQLANFRPSLSFNRFHGSIRKFSKSADVVITSYAILRREPETFAEHWNTIVVDEGQNIKNPDSATTKAVVQLSADFRLSLSGTPVENKAEDLWSQFHFLFPELLGSRGEFEKRFARPLRRGDQRASESLQRRIAPFVLRRRKQEVAKELPPKTEVILHCELNDDERELYQAVYLSSKESVRKALNESGGMLAALEALLRLRQVCAHPSLLPDTERDESSKCNLLLESLLRSKEAGHRCLVFSQWTSMLDLIEDQLTEAELSFLRLDGSTKDRKSVIDAFQKDDGPDLFLLSLKAGGVGITLTAADHIYLYDSWWNPAVEDQAADRAHRIGQENPVLVHRLIVRDTVEENVLALQEKKREMADMILSGASSGAGLSREDLALLFDEV